MDFEDDSLTRMKNKIILALCSLYPITASSGHLVSFLSDIGIQSDDENVISFLQSLEEDGIIEKKDDTWILVKDGTTLEKIARPFLEDEDTFTFMESPFVKAVADRDYFLQRAPAFKVSLAKLPTQLHIYLGMTDSAGDVDKIYASIMDQIGMLGTQPEFLYWFTYPDDMVERLTRVYNVYGTEGIDRAIGDDKE